MYELASVYDAAGEYDKAIELLEKVVKIAKRVGHPDARVKRSREKLEMIKAKASPLKSGFRFPTIAPERLRARKDSNLRPTD